MSDGAPSISKTLGAMEPGELLRLRGELDELKGTRGWQLLVDLVEVQRQKVEAHAQREALPGPTQLAGSVDELIKAQTVAAYASGTHKGLGQFLEIIATVDRTATAVQEKLDQDEPTGEGR